MIFYTSELKQYSTDVFCSMVLWTAFASTARARVSPRSYALLAGAGAFTLWFSIPIVFVMAGVGLSFAGWHGYHRRWRNCRGLPALAPCGSSASPAFTGFSIAFARGQQ